MSSGVSRTSWRLPHHLAKRAGQDAQDLGVLAYGVQRLLQDGTDVLEAYLQKHLGFHALYLQLDLVEPRIDADREVQEVGQLYQDRDMSPEVLDLKGDPIDLKFGDVQQHVRILV